MRISDWSSDVCSSDLVRLRRRRRGAGRKAAAPNVASVREEEFADADGDKPARRAPAKKAPAKRASAKDDGVAEKPAAPEAKPDAVEAAAKPDATEAKTAATEAVTADDDATPAAEKTAGNAADHLYAAAFFLCAIRFCLTHSNTPLTRHMSRHPPSPY